MNEDALVEFEHPEVGSITIAGESPDEYVIGLIRTSRRFYEAGLLDLLEHLGFGVGTAIDAGAHIGNHTVFFTKVLGLKTIAVEPRKESYDLLTENIERNVVADMVSSYNLALGAREGRGRLEQRVDGNSGAVAVVADVNGPIEVLRIDDLIGADSEVVLVKVDVEGAEAEVIEGAMETIDRFRPVISTEAHSGVALDRIDRLLSPMDYSLITIEGRSDNFIFGSRSKNSPIPFAQAIERAALISRRRNEQILDSGFRATRSQLRSVAEQMAKGHAELKTELDTMLSRLEQVNSFTSELAEQTRRADRFRYEYERLSRSRALRFAHRIRRMFSKLGLGSGFAVRSVEDIESSLGAHHPSVADE